MSAPVGGILALWLTGTPFSVSSGIGFLALFGVSVQTALVYISYVNELRLAGTPLAEAIREAAILRLRPIMMTALVAALGLLPAALATGVGTDTQRPFALVIVSGLLACLLISVFLMPALYALVARERRPPRGLTAAAGKRISQEKLAEREGIRTLDTVLPYTHFPGERLRPLGHRSAFARKRAPLRGEPRMGKVAGHCGAP